VSLVLRANLVLLIVTPTSPASMTNSCNKNKIIFFFFFFFRKT